MKPLRLYEVPLEKERVLDVESVLQDSDWYGGRGKANQRTRIFESTACIVAMKGTAFKRGGLESVMSDSEFDPTAKEFFTRFLNEFGSDNTAVKALLDWIVLIGGPTAELRPIKSFIQKSINDYYDKAPKSFEVATALKTNTTDIILIVDGKKDDLFRLLDELEALDAKYPDAKTPPSAKRISTTRKGMCSILDTNKKKILSFYQVSLKKGYGEAQAGKGAEWLNKNYISGTEITKKGTEKTRSIATPGGAWDVGKERGAIKEELETIEDELLREGLLDFLKGKITSAIENVRNFVKWSASFLPRMVRSIIPKIERFAQKVIKRDKGIRAIENILSNVGVPLTEEYFNEASGTNVRLTPSLMNDFKIVDKEFLRGRKINEIHRNNVKLYQKLNQQKVKGREMDPIVMLQGIDAGLISVEAARKEIQSLLKKKPNKQGVWPEVTRQQLNLIFKLGGNFSANVALNGILNGVGSILKNKNIKTLSTAIFTLAASLESEVKFGNTALPVIIVYGGKKGKLEVLGKREDYEEKRLGELTQTGKNLTNFPWLVLSVQKSGGKEKYNTVGFKLLSTFKYKDDKPVPVWMPYSVRTNSGSSFTCTIEAGTPTDNWRGRN